MLNLQFCVAAICLAAMAATQTEAIDLVLILDVGQNMAEPIKLIREGVHLATYEIGAEDKISVMSFCSEIKILSPFTVNTKQVEGAFTKAKPPILRMSGKRLLYDAIFDGIQQFLPMANLNRNRAVAVITNDVDRGSSHQPQELIEEARSKNIIIWMFLIGNPYANPSDFDKYVRVPYPDVVLAKEQLGPLATKTGGKISVYVMDKNVLKKAIAACKGR